MKQQLVDMLTLQEQINSKVHSNWREQNFEWYRAIWIESAELLDHYGWKWWKKQSPDLAQVQLELVDIWHFGLSMALQDSADHDALAQVLTGQFINATQADTAFAETLERFVAKVVGNKQFDVRLFAQLVAQAEMNFSDLYSMYVGKNVLNRFRQDHGYQEGSYQKLWNGREDNEHLAELLTRAKNHQLDDGVNFLDWIYEQLSQRYSQN